MKGSKSPQSNWATYHFKNGAGTAESTIKESSMSESEWDNLMATLKTIVEQEKGDIMDAVEKVQTQVLAKLSGMDPFDAMRKVLVICSVVMLKSAKNLIVALLDILESFVKSLLDGLDKPLDFPVLSWMYEKVARHPLTVLDVMCLICAIQLRFYISFLPQLHHFRTNSLSSRLPVQRTSMPS
jgi:hypothetical protein